jgi:hypothetical protein
LSISLESFFRPVRRKVFISYHHGGDQHFYDELSRIYHDRLEALTDNSLSRMVQSDDSEYVMRRIRELHLTGSSCTIVLCGAQTPARKYVDWEIQATLNQSMGLVGVGLPTLTIGSSGGTHKPRRLQDNIDSGYAAWVMWYQLAQRPQILLEAIESAIAKPARLIDNTAVRMSRNA